MANSLTPLTTSLTTFYSNAWTNNTTASTVKASTSIIASPTSDLSSLLSSPVPPSKSASSLTPLPFISSSTPYTILPPSTSASSLTALLVTHATALINSVTPVTTFDVKTTTKSVSSSTLSEEERRNYLDMLQEDEMRKLMPSVIFLAIIAVTGLIGNSMVLLVYFNKARRTPTDIFIIAIAAFDLISNVLAIPVEIYTLFHFWDHDLPAFCKFRVYLNSFTTMSSAMALLAVAFSRYRKICRPFGKQTSMKTAKVTAVVIPIACSIISIPHALLFGIQTKQSPRPDVLGQECTIADEYMYTKWPMVYNAFLLLLFFTICVPLIVFYVLIGVQAWRHSTFQSVVATIHLTPTSSDQNQTKSDLLGSKDNLDEKPKSCGLFSRKAKCNITFGNSSTDDERSDSNPDNYGTKMMRSPPRGENHVNMPMLRELTFKLNNIRDNEINTEEDIKTSEETFTKMRTPVKEIRAFNEMETSLNTATVNTNNGGCENNHITFHETKYVDLKTREDLKSCDSSPRNGTLKSKSGKSKNTPQRRVLTKTTLMLLIISAVYVIAILPYLILISCKSAVPDFVINLNDVGYACYNLFLRFYSINSASNAFIYSICDVRFRKQVKAIMKCRK